MRDPAGLPAELLSVPARLTWPSFRRAPHALGALTVAMVCIYALSPYLALWSLSSALRAHDTNSMAQHIDWDALTSSLKAEAVDAIVGPPPAADDLPDFGSSFATGAVSHAIDAHLTPELVMGFAAQMIDGQKATSLPSVTELYNRLSAHFIAPAEFEAGLVMVPGQQPTMVHMKFEHWQWKVTRLDIPKAV